MSRKPFDKNALLSALAAHVLEYGLNSASLRPMAASAGTSDRMLIYHFGSKDGLIVELLQFLAEGMAMQLDQALPPLCYETEQELIENVLAVMRSEAFAAYSRVWFDIVSAAAQGSGPHQKAAGTIVGIFLEWLARRHPQGHAGAPRALVFIEGCIIMDVAGRQDVSDAINRGSGC
ncbi:TetR/AcrR family transcriptional regulator [Thalassospira sp. TSL5-1]|uniref:TetR/AcrR family transcriptional regulator n=1 Tax=Thalassospira sp. TSL5-1 TaxID=1544451 RepID=UPI00093B6480|nr:TetR/AcrR family transcriptional regulator [Thalassospira sp. TSL5-1]